MANVEALRSGRHLVARLCFLQLFQPQKKNVCFNFQLQGLFPHCRALCGPSFPENYFDGILWKVAGAALPDFVPIVLTIVVCEYAA